MILFGIPTQVNRFFRPLFGGLSRPIRNALPAMVLALLLAPHRRCLRTLAQSLLGNRVHAATISRRLHNPRWRTRQWYKTLSQDTLDRTDAFEKSLARRRRERRKWVITIDATHHGTKSQDMENLVEQSSLQRRRQPNLPHGKRHVFLMGLVHTDRGGRIPLPRLSYYTQAYCDKYKKKYRTLGDLVVLMLRELRVPDDVDVTVVYDSAFDADKIHRICRNRGFREVFPLDPNRNFSADDDPQSPALPDQPVVASTYDWSFDEFHDLDLHVENEGHAFFRRRHLDNLRVRKTRRHYVVAARCASVSKLGGCIIVTSYKERPEVELLPGQSGDWRDVHAAGPVRRRRRPRPSRWTRKVLACTDVAATARQVVEWYEVRWQIELFFREIKSRLQFEGYVFMKFEAVERYIDLLMMGFLLLERERLEALRRSNRPPEVGQPAVHARTTDRLRDLESQIWEWNIEHVERAMRTPGGRRRLLRELRELCPRLAQVA